MESFAFFILMNHHGTLRIFLKTILLYTRMIHAVDWMPTVLSAAGGTAGNTHVTRGEKRTRFDICHSQQCIKT